MCQKAWIRHSNNSTKIISITPVVYLLRYLSAKLEVADSMSVGAHTVRLVT